MNKIDEFFDNKPLKDVIGYFVLSFIVFAFVGFMLLSPEIEVYQQKLEQKMRLENSINDLKLRNMMLLNQNNKKRNKLNAILKQNKELEKSIKTTEVKLFIDKMSLMAYRYYLKLQKLEYTGRNIVFVLHGNFVNFVEFLYALEDRIEGVSINKIVVKKGQFIIDFNVAKYYYFK
ncbi:MAG: hypothetical protein GXO40_04165 [Epsilonproteobacteria bacterium]|nr:hypothetical protein [Campylobacterota bacterium]